VVGGGRRREKRNRVSFNKKKLPSLIRWSGPEVATNHAVYVRFSFRSKCGRKGKRHPIREGGSPFKGEEKTPVVKRH